MNFKPTTLLGLMSGTSLDGLDIVLCTFEEHKGKFSYKIHDATTIDYPASLREQLRQAYHMSAYDYVKLDRALGKYMGNECNAFIARQQLMPSAIASHGHTVFHDLDQRVTAQIGSGAEIHAATSLPVICDFRSVDIALGGQGAPLVPIGDQLLFHDYEACLNLGGIANISYDHQGERQAYDIGAVNMVMNQLAAQAGKAYDKDGMIARSGTMDATLAKQLDALSFYQQSPPKSLGVEWVEKKVMPLLNQSGLSIADQLHTYTLHVAKQLAIAIDRVTHQGSQTLVTGGGAYNTFLIEGIQQNLKNSALHIPPPEIIDFKEALIFAFLGYLKLYGQCNCLKSVTGAQDNNVGGVVYG